ncbi:MAG: F-type H+-transporting ATPase subunit epsilon [Actinomycetota bacterium]|jgi:F-type H+-transporting ATPase subunit epsilon|nr:F-type H+-transporting ATPase subunit epsilon [Actinomycetota bacterium]
MQVSIVSPEKEVFRGDADLVIARSPEGEFGIMRNHIPFLAALVPGVVTVVSGGSREAFFVPGGFLEASKGSDDESEDAYHVIVLADDAVPAGSVSADEVKQKIEEAIRRSQGEDAEISDAQVQAAIQRVEMASQS